MPELMATLVAIHKKDERAQGIEQVQEGPTFDDIKRKAMGITTSADDVVSLQGEFAKEAGFGIGMGLGYRRI